MEWVYGINAVQKMLEHAPERVQALYLREGLGKKRVGRLRSALGSAGVRPQNVSEQELRRITGTDKHQGVAAKIAPLAPMDEGEALEYLAGLDSPLVLVLDSVQDPRNYGACLRTADAAGVSLVVTGKHRAVDNTPVVSKVASGAAELQPTARVTNLARFLRALKDQGFWLVGTDEEGSESPWSVNLTGRIALVMGNEGEGLRRLTRESCDTLVRLPMAGAVESLNLSVATGICLYEALRQRDNS